jgi:hypothetical protein
MGALVNIFQSHTTRIHWVGCSGIWKKCHKLRAHCWAYVSTRQHAHVSMHTSASVNKALEVAHRTRGSRVAYVSIRQYTLMIFPNVITTESSHRLPSGFNSDSTAGASHNTSNLRSWLLTTSLVVQQ